jgi:hypothetical protein
MRATRAILAIGLTLALAWWACEDDIIDGFEDVTAPARVTDLAVDSVTASSITLKWTAPGDDGTSGVANRYVLKRSGAPIDGSNFSAATTISGVPAPAVAGALESFVVGGLDSTVAYYFAIRTFDEEDNASGVSNNAVWTPPGLHLSKIIPSYQDNTLYEEDGLCDFCPGSNGVLDSLSNGAGEFVFTGRNNLGDARRALMAFAIHDSLPVGATIDSVVLTLRMSRTPNNDDPRTIALHRVLADWGEGTSDANCCGPEEGTGGTAAMGDATWAFRIFRSAAWATLGGDFVGGVSAARSVNNVGSYSWRSAQMIADVQGWLDTPSSNFGWILIGDESASQTAKRFDAHETAATGPRLTVYYTVPAP